MTLSDYLSLFPSSEWEKPRFMALAEAVLQQALDLLPLIASLQSGFSFASAEGKQLDAIAAAVGLSRSDIGLNVSDADFRAYLLSKLALWSWDGTNGGAPDVITQILPGSKEKDNQDGTVTVTLNGSLPVPAKELFPVPAGIQVE